MIRNLNEALRRRPVSSMKRFYIFTGDSLPHGVGLEWKLLSTVGKRSDHRTVIPDAYSFSWPEIGIKDFESYNFEMYHKTLESTQSQKVLNRAFWRGSIHQNFARVKFNEYVRDRPEFDVSDSEQTGFFEMKDVGGYSTLIDLPGQGYSARLKHLLVSGRPVIVYPREHWDWVTLRLEPGIHFCTTIPSVEDLANRCLMFLGNPDAREHYAKAAYQVSSLISKDSLYNAIAGAIGSCD